MSRIISIEAFGFRDVVSVSNLTNRSSNYYLANVVFPFEEKNPIYGNYSKVAATQSGIGYSIDSIIQKSFNDQTTCNRVLIPLLWRKMILCKKKEALFKSGYSCAKLLAGHINNLLDNFVKKTQEPITSEDQLVLSIPNGLDLYGQEYLLRSLQSYTKNHLDKVTLIWRPIASLLFNLEHGDKTSFSGEDKVGVIYVGPDAIENSIYVFRKSEKTGALLPLRLRKFAHTLRYSGMDVISSLIKHDLSEDTDLSIEWKFENTAVDYWKRVCGYFDYKKEYPYNTPSGWKIRSAASHTPLNQIQIQKYKSGSFLIGEKTEENFWAYDSEQKVTDVFSSDLFKENRLNAILVCGPMASEEIVNSVADSLNFTISNQLQKNNVCFSKNYDDIASGAYLYKEKLNNNEDTYLDELDPLELCYQDNFEWKYEPIIEEEKTVPGGWADTIEIPQRFKIEKNTQNFDIYMSQKDDDGIREHRKGTAKFNKPSKEEVKFRLEVKYQAVSGLAKVVFYSDGSDYFPKEGLPFDYSKMEIIGQLPEIELYAPKEALKIPTQNRYTDSYFMELKLFLNSNTNDISDKLLKLTSQVGRHINFNGKTCNRQYDDYVKLLSEKVEKEYKRKALVNGKQIPFLNLITNSSREYSQAPRTKLFRNSAYLFKLIPKNVLEDYHLLFCVANSKSYSLSWRFYFYPMCRVCLADPSYIDDIMEHVIRLPLSELRKTHFIRGIMLLLNYSHEARLKMSEKFANKLVELCLYIFREAKENQKNFKKTVVSNGSYLLLLALKYRDKQPNFLYPVNNEHYSKIVDEYLDLSDYLLNILESNYKNEKSSSSYYDKMKKTVGLVLEYIDKKGKAGIEKLIEEAEENNDDSD